MINFEKLKVVIFDFDDTLAIHSDHAFPEREQFQENVMKVLQDDYTVFNDCSPNDFMKEFMELCSTKDLHLGLVSHCESSKIAKMKCEWVLRNYGHALENYCVSSREMKLVTLRSLAEMLHCKADEILIVDDLYTTLDEAASAGFQAATPMEIVNFVSS